MDDTELEELFNEASLPKPTLEITADPATKQVPAPSVPQVTADPATKQVPAPSVPQVTADPAKQVQSNVPQVTADDPTKQVQTSMPQVTADPTKQVSEVTADPTKQVQSTVPQVTADPAKLVQSNVPQVTADPTKQVQSNVPQVTADDPTKQVQSNVPPVTADDPTKQVGMPDMPMMPPEVKAWFASMMGNTASPDEHITGFVRSFSQQSLSSTVSSQPGTPGTTVSKEDAVDLKPSDEPSDSMAKQKAEADEARRIQHRFHVTPIQK